MAGKPTDPATHRIPTGLRLSPDIMQRLEAYSHSLPQKPSRTMIIETAIREFLDREEAAAMAAIAREIKAA